MTHWNREPLAAASDSLDAFSIKSKSAAKILIRIVLVQALMGPLQYALQCIRELTTYHQRL
jgi:hypothetical protein